MSTSSKLRLVIPKTDVPVPSFQTRVIEVSATEFKGAFFVDGVGHVLNFTLSTAEEMHVAVLRAVQAYYREKTLN